MAQNLSLTRLLEFLWDHTLSNSKAIKIAHIVLLLLPRSRRHIGNLFSITFHNNRMAPRHPPSSPGLSLVMLFLRSSIWVEIRQKARFDFSIRVNLSNKVKLNDFLSVTPIYCLLLAYYIRFNLQSCSCSKWRPSHSGKYWHFLAHKKYKKKWAKNIF